MTLNPYSHKDFFSFLKIFFQRLFHLDFLNFSEKNIPSDELQIFVLIFISAGAAMVGVFMIYRKMTMLANALSHSVLFGIALTYLSLKASSSIMVIDLSTKQMLGAALLTGFLTAFLTQVVTKFSKLQKDASIGLVFTTLFAVGVLLISIFSRNAHIGVELVLGNVDALHFQDLKSTSAIFLLNGIVILLFFKGLKLTSFDPVYAHMQGVSVAFYNYLMIFLLSMTSICAFRAVGVVLVLSFFIVPALSAKLFSSSLKTQLFLAIVIGAVASLFGVALSRHLLSVHQLALSTGGLTTLVLYALFFISVFALYLKRALYRYLKQRNITINWLGKEQKLTRLN